MPGPVSDSAYGPPDDGPYVPSWCYPNNAPRVCKCGCHEGYHNDRGTCLRADRCHCAGFADVGATDPKPDGAGQVP
jgi:hypothetical protein